MLTLNSRFNSDIKGTMHTQKWAKQSGFTIVELLIVIVVIAILAAITIVSYNGIQNRAKESAAQSGAAQVAKKIALWQVDNPSQTPADLAIVGINTSNASSTTFEYTPGTAGVWCTTVSVTGVSYYVDNTKSTPSKGGCRGHAQNGTVAITNLLPNPSVEESTAYFTSVGSPGTRTTERTNVDTAFSGSWFFRTTMVSSGNIAGFGNSNAEVLPNGEYVGTVWVRSNSAMTVRPWIEGNSTKSVVAVPTQTVLTPNTWTRLQANITITAPGTLKIGWLAVTAPVAAGVYLDMDGVMLTSGTAVPNYADGNSDNWTWNGTPHASTSKGVPL
jgi:prepilin-type N-terminal cleavage/methylation domain-containing protein